MTTNPLVTDCRRLKWSEAVKIGVVIIVGLFVFGRIFSGAFPDDNLADKKILGAAAVGPTEDLVLPVVWGDLGQRLVASGVIDTDKFEALYARRGALAEYERALLTGSTERLIINQDNAGVVLNLLWALGLGNRNPILEEGPMNDPRYGGPSGFASTGGWPLARGNPMSHYNQHAFVALTPAQQALVERVSKNIYRPCCDNSTYFPDCNHGLAMLGLLELMAARGTDESEMYAAALRVNAFWFPDAYETIARFLGQSDIAWGTTDPETILNRGYSSLSGFTRVQSLGQKSGAEAALSCGA